MDPDAIAIPHTRRAVAHLMPTRIDLDHPGAGHRENSHRPRTPQHTAGNRPPNRLPQPACRTAQTRESVTRRLTRSQTKPQAGRHRQHRPAPKAVDPAFRRSDPEPARRQRHSSRIPGR
ncbi:hypothetical protein RHA1_ro08427 (plasmid) [Rhodococcus jostii RHA1]|uniref:Uncharacterized protein n=1 Tax=Rhodococcus jostii (strain RHA1) TaxID=101510 RepID=Q0RZ15_RHOJR|nr:hypothetical protein RHA1_ro08427 [Rhodococcus jostii RHA1]